MEKRVLTTTQYKELINMIVHYGFLLSMGLYDGRIIDQEVYEESNDVFVDITKYLINITDVTKEI